MTPPDSTPTCLFAAGSDALGRPQLARVELAGDALELHVRAYVDPMVRSGRGGSSGVITGLASLADGDGGSWVVASVERGRPRLVDPDRLGVVALLGRRREWRGAAETDSPFLSLVADRSPCEALGHRFLLAHARTGVDLLRVRPSQPVERWWLGPLARTVELLAGPSTLALVDRGRVAILDVDELVAGGFPLTDPRDVELALEWSALPSTVAAVTDVLERPLGLRTFERSGDAWHVTELELRAGGPVIPRGRWPIARPHRWRRAGDSMWLHTAAGWSHVARDRGPSPSVGLGLGHDAAAAVAVALDPAGHPWLWQWTPVELARFDALALTEPPRRWSFPAGREPIRARELLVTTAGRSGDPRAVVHADELAELLPLDPTLAARWPTWFDR